MWVIHGQRELGKNLDDCYYEPPTGKCFMKMYLCKLKVLKMKENKLMH